MIDLYIPELILVPLLLCNDILSAHIDTATIESVVPKKGSSQIIPFSLTRQLAQLLSHVCDGRKLNFHIEN